MDIIPVRCSKCDSLSNDLLQSCSICHWKLTPKKNATVQYAHYSSICCGVLWLSIGLMFRFHGRPLPLLGLGAIAFVAYLFMCHYDNKFQENLF